MNPGNDDLTEQMMEKRQDRARSRFHNADGATPWRKNPFLSTVFCLDWCDGQIAGGRREDVPVWHDLEPEQRER